MTDMTPWRGRTNRSPNLGEWRGHPLERLRREFDSLFDRFFGGWPTPFAGESLWMHPADLDVTTQGNEMVVRAEVPGFEASDLDIRVQGDFLTIRAEHKEEGEKQQSYGRFEESIRIPSGTDPDKVQATYRNGILELHLPLPEGAQGKRIPIRGDGGAAPAQGAKSAAAKG